MDPFLPLGRVTGIGSLPHRDPVQAVDFVAAHSPAIPFWPQLPQVAAADNMIGQMLAPLADLLTATSPAHYSIAPALMPELRRRLRAAPAWLDEASAAGFYAFECGCAAGTFPAAVALKGQLTGPVTLGYCLFTAGHALATLPAVHDELTDYLCRLGLWQIGRLARFGLPLLLFVDEAALGLANLPDYALTNLRRLISTLRAAGATVGIHCCAATDPALLYAAGPQIISFDAHSGLERFLEHPALHEFVAAGGWLSFGLVPTLRDLNEFSVLDTFMRWLGRAEQGYDPRQLAKQSLITATCGLGLLDEAAAGASFAQCGQLAQLLARRVRLT